MSAPRLNDRYLPVYSMAEGRADTWLVMVTEPARDGIVGQVALNRFGEWFTEVYGTTNQIGRADGPYATRTEAVGAAVRHWMEGRE